MYLLTQENTLKDGLDFMEICNGKGKYSFDNKVFLWTPKHSGDWTPSQNSMAGTINGSEAQINIIKRPGRFEIVKILHFFNFWGVF